MILVQRATCSGCSSCIICLSETRSHCEGGARPVSSSFTPTSSWIFLFRSLMSFCAASIDLLYGPTPYVLRSAMSPSSSARIGSLFSSSSGSSSAPPAADWTGIAVASGAAATVSGAVSAADRQSARISNDLAPRPTATLSSSVGVGAILHRHGRRTRTPALGKALKKEALKTLRRAKYEMKRLRSARLHFSGPHGGGASRSASSSARAGTRRSGASTSASPTARRCGTP